MAKPNALAIPSKLIAVGPAGAHPPIAAAPQPKNTSANVPTNSAICLFTRFRLQNLSVPAIRWLRRPPPRSSKAAYRLSIHETVHAWTIGTREEALTPGAYVEGVAILPD